MILQQFDYSNFTDIKCNCSLSDYDCCNDTNCTCNLTDGTLITDCNCTNCTIELYHRLVLNNSLDDNSVFSYDGDRILNVTDNMNGVFLLSDLNGTEPTHKGYCIEYNASTPWMDNGTTGILINNLNFVRNSLDGSYVGDYIKVLICLYDNAENYNIKDLIYVFTDGDYLNSDIPEIKNAIKWTNNEGTLLANGFNWIGGDWYCHEFATFINPTTRQNMIIFNYSCQDIPVPVLSASKVANDTYVQNGDIINYTITVSNDNDVHLHNVTVTDIPDSQYLTYLGWNNTLLANGSEEVWYKGEGFVWYLNRTLLPGENAKFNVFFRVNYNLSPIIYSGLLINNTINAESNETDIVKDVEQLIPEYPYLVVKKDTLDTNVSQGDKVRFLVTVTNIGTCSANNVEIYDSWYSSYLRLLDWEAYDNHSWKNPYNSSSSFRIYLNGTLESGESHLSF